MPFFGGGGASVANMVGATSSVAGTAGLCPAPAAGDQGAYLKGDATFEFPFAAQRKFFNSTQAGYSIKPFGANAAGAIGPVNGRIYFTIFYLPVDTYTKIGIVTAGGTSGVSTTFRIGLYECDQETLAATNRLYQSAETAFASSSSSISVTGLSISITRAGFYAAAFMMDNRSTWTSRGLGATVGSLFLTSRESDSNVNEINSYYVTGTNTATSFPSSITASDIIVINAGAGAYIEKS